MTEIKGEILIDRSVEDVFDFVADQRNEPRYNPRMVRAAPKGAVRLMAPLITWVGCRQEQAIWTSMKRYLESTMAAS